MIKPGEIQQKARLSGVRDQQIEKDYVLSWILQGVARHEHLSKRLAFKGGTVLKKVFFEDYRFSEDLISRCSIKPSRTSSSLVGSPNPLDISGKKPISRLK